MATQSLWFIGIKHRWIYLLVYTIVFVAICKSPSAARVTTIIFIVDQHVRVQLDECPAPWPQNGINKAIVDA
jgi:hypothetical protein